MRSTDQTTSARIRDAAIECFADAGFAATSVRTIAARAGVSPGLVIHHFGSKEKLRVACDEYVAEFIRELKGGAMAAGANFDPLAAMRAQRDGPPVSRYVAKTLTDGSPHVAELVDEFVADAQAYMEVGVENGMITPSRFPKERAAILTMWSLGALVLHEHLERHVGVDITSDIQNDPKAATSYMGLALELAGGFITETTKKLMADAFVAEPASEDKKKEDQ